MQQTGEFKERQLKLKAERSKTKKSCDIQCTFFSSYFRDFGVIFLGVKKDNVPFRLTLVMMGG